MKFAARVDAEMSVADKLGSNAAIAVGSAVLRQYEPLHDDQKPPPIPPDTPVGRLRRYAKQARQSAAKTTPSDAMKLHLLVQKLRQRRHAYAPVRNQQAAPSSRASKAVIRAESGASAGPAAWRLSLADLTAQRRASPLAPQSNRQPVDTLAAGPAVTEFGSTHLQFSTLGVAALRQIAGSPGGSALAPSIRTVTTIGAQPGRTRPHAAPARAPVPQPSAARLTPSVATLQRLANPQRSSIAPRAAGRSSAPPIRAAGQTTQYDLNPKRPAPAYAHTTYSAARRIAGQTTPPGVDATAEVSASKAALQRDVAASIREYWERQARMPPSGATAFDPRVTPSWAGLQMPG